MARLLTSVFTLLALLVPSVVLAQGVLIDAAPNQKARLPRPIIAPGPRPTPIPRPIPAQMSYKIKSLEVNAAVTDQVAKVQMTQSFVNTGNRQMEVSFMFPLPYDGAISALTLLVDGKEYEAKLLDRNEARNTYEEIVRRSQDPALLEWMGTGMFKTSVFPVPPGAERKVSLRYSQLCRKDGGLTDFLFPLSTAKYTTKPIETVSFRISINSTTPIKNVYSPSHKIEVTRPDDARAVIKYTEKDTVPASDFRLIYDASSEDLGASVISYRPEAGEDGFLLLLASPKISPITDEMPKKTVIFVVDRSGSMSGKKIEQAKGALKFVLDNLRDGDLFNVIVYDTIVESFKPELQKYDDKTRQEALGFVDGIYAGGSTNISGALTAALSQLKDNKQPSYVIFLTDGLPTTGEKNEAKIVEMAKAANDVRARVLSLGVGYDVNSRLLDKLVRANHGQSEYVRPNEDIEARVSSLYRKISDPVLTDVAVKVDVEGSDVEQGAAVNRVYPKDTIDLFAGQQLVLVARYSQPGKAKVTITGQVGGVKQTYDFPADLVKKSGDESYAFAEKLWATRRVGEIIDEIDLNGKNDELVEELVKLSKKHGILTPYTSFFADDQVAVNQPVADQVRRAEVELKALDRAAGEGGFAQRAGKGRLQNAAQAPTAGSARYYKSDSDGAVVANNVYNVGAKTFYRGGAQWIDASVTADEVKKAIKIKRFSKQYFDLVDKHGKDVAKYLAIEDPVVIKLDGKVYTF